MNTTFITVCILGFSIGFGIAFKRAVEKAVLCAAGRKRYSVHVLRLAKKGFTVQEAMRIVSFKRRAAKLDAIGYTTVMFVFLFAAADVVATTII